MNRYLVLTIAWGVCISFVAIGAEPSGIERIWMELPIDATRSAVQSAAERIVSKFADVSTPCLGDAATPPSIVVRNTPNLAYFDHRAWAIVLAHWPTLDSTSREFFLELTDTEEEAGTLFVTLFNGFLVAHEMAHWLQRTNEIELDRYTSERTANDLAVAFFQTTEDAEAQLLSLRAHLKPALDRLSNPTPPGADEATFFNTQYAALASEPSLYASYQFRFIIDSIDRRAELDFAALCLGRDW